MHSLLYVPLSQSLSTRGAFPSMLFRSLLTNGRTVHLEARRSQDFSITTDQERRVGLYRMRLRTTESRSDRPTSSSAPLEIPTRRCAADRFQVYLALVISYAHLFTHCIDEPFLGACASSRSTTQHTYETASLLAQALREQSSKMAGRMLPSLNVFGDSLKLHSTQVSCCLLLRFDRLAEMCL